MQRPLPRPGGDGEARRPGGRRPAPGVPGHVPGRGDHAAHDDALPQPRLHGRGGVDPGQPPRRGGAAGGLRQDHPLDADGRRQLRPADAGRLRRAHAQRQVPWARHRFGDRRVAVLRGAAGRPHDRARVRRGRGLHVALRRPLHDHGHGLHHGLHGRGPGPDPARGRRDPGGRLAPQVAGPARRQPHRGDGEGGPAPVADPRPPGLRERDPRQRRHRRLHQLRRPPAGPGRPRRGRAVPGRLSTPSAAACPCSSTSCPRAAS